MHYTKTERKAPKSSLTGPEWKSPLRFLPLKSSGRCESWERSGFTQVCRCTLVYTFVPVFVLSCMFRPPAFYMTLLTSLFLPLHFSLFLSPPLCIYERLSPLSCLSSFKQWFTGNDVRLHRNESESMFWRTFCPVCLVCITKGEKRPDLVLAMLFCSRTNVG